MINYNTPIQTYKVGNKEIDVKRDDLQGDGIFLPPWGKLASIEKVLLEGDLDKNVPIIQLSVRASYSGWALAKLGTDLGYKIQIAYPNSKNFPQENVKKWEQFGVEIVPLRPNMSSIVLGQMKKYARENNLQTIPYGFEHPVYLKYWEEKLSGYDYDTLVVCAGTPVTCLGMIKGFKGDSIHCVATSSLKTVERQFKKYDINDDRVQVHTTPFEFYDEMKDFQTPFPCNVNWDKKVWWWVTQNMDKLNGNVLFWNLGA